MAHLYAVTDAERNDRPGSEQHGRCADTLHHAAETLRDAIGDADDLTGDDYVHLSELLADTAQLVGEARRIVGKLGHQWILRNGDHGKAHIGGDVYRATTSGSASSLKEADKARLANDAFERLAEWLTAAYGSDEDSDTTLRLLLSVVQAQLGQAFSLSPRAAVLSAGLDGEPVDGVPWRLDVSKYETPSTGAGPMATFEKVQPKKGAK